MLNELEDMPSQRAVVLIGESTAVAARPSRTSAQFARKRSPVLMSLRLESGSEP